MSVRDNSINICNILELDIYYKNLAHKANDAFHKRFDLYESPADG